MITWRADSPETPPPMMQIFMVSPLIVPSSALILSRSPVVVCIWCEPAERRQRALVNEARGSRQRKQQSTRTDPGRRRMDRHGCKWQSGWTPARRKSCGMEIGRSTKLSWWSRVWRSGSDYQSQLKAPRHVPHRSLHHCRGPGRGPAQHHNTPYVTKSEATFSCSFIKSVPNEFYAENTLVTRAPVG